MTTTRPAAAPQAKPQQSEADEYLDAVFSSWPAMGYMQRQGKSLLVINIGLTPDAAEDALSDWLRKHGVKP